MALQEVKAPSPIDVNELGKITVVKLEQLLNTSLPMIVTGKIITL